MKESISMNYSIKLAVLSITYTLLTVVDDDNDNNNDSNYRLVLFKNKINFTNN